MGTGIHVFKLLMDFKAQKQQAVFPLMAAIPSSCVTPSILSFAELLPMRAAAATLIMAQPLQQVLLA